MKKHLRYWFGTAMGAVFALAMGSCAYDPNYAVGGTYSTGYGGGYGYGDGYGYGNSGFSTSLFVSTGDSRWGYDPSCYSYYDYSRRCYYDPYLYGYYPVGYRPVVVVGAPHPHGYNRSYCPPPVRVRNNTLSNYRNREYAYRNSSYAWAHQVRQQGGTVRSQPQFQQQQAPYYRSGNPSHSGNRNLTPVPGGYPRTNSGSNFNNGQGNPPVHRQAGLPSNYNVPIRTNPQGNAGPAMNAGRSHANSYQGGSQMRTGGLQPQPQMRQQQAPPAAKVHGLGQGKEGKEGKEDKRGWGGSGR